MTEAEYKLVIGLKALDEQIVELEAELDKLEITTAYEAIMATAKIRGVLNYMKRWDKR